MDAKQCEDRSGGILQIALPGSYLPDYPPVSIGHLMMSCNLYKWIISPTYEIVESAQMVFTKLPAIAADLLGCVLLFLLLSQWKSRRMGLVAAAIFALHPAVIYNSSIWGQMDSVYTVFVLAAFTAMAYRLFTTAVICLLPGTLAKAQAGLYLPLLLFTLPFNRAILRRTAVATGILALCVIIPFAMGGALNGLLHTFNPTVIVGQDNLSGNAFNVWWTFYGIRARDMLTTDTFLLGISFKMTGILLITAAYGSILFLLRTRLRSGWSTDTTIKALYAASLLIFIVFMVGTQMLERYLFPFIALALPLALLSWRTAAVYAAVSVFHYLNVTYTFSFQSAGQFFFSTVPAADITIAHALLVLLIFWIILFFVLLPMHSVQTGWKRLLPPQKLNDRMLATA